MKAQRTYKFRTKANGTVTIREHTFDGRATAKPTSSKSADKEKVMSTSTAERIVQGARRYGSRKAKLIAKRGSGLPSGMLALYIRAGVMPVVEPWQKPENSIAACMDRIQQADLQYEMARDKVLAKLSD